MAATSPTRHAPSLCRLVLPQARRKVAGKVLEAGIERASSGSSIGRQVAEALNAEGRQGRVRRVAFSFLSPYKVRWWQKVQTGTV